ncbi:regulatory protein RecX [Anaerococcus provencensis]|uniref:regulatory protein RecX n=1 Tax=Anaerococcus provencensis TaxID=938293 RepID=UPI000303D3A1|nr:regulatory protein RecX [Anaerococcus provencensis]
MIIEKIDYSDKYNLIILTIAGEEFSVTYDFFNDLNLSLEDEVDFDTYKEILKENQYNMAKNFALGKISYSQKTSFELEKLLKDNDFDTDVINKTIEFLKSYKLIDDKAYVKSFINDKSHISKWSRNKIRYALRSKKIDDQLTETYLSYISDEEEFQKAYDFAIKKSRGKTDYDTKQKVYRYLSSKGFEYDIISKAIGEIFP